MMMNSGDFDNDGRPDILLSGIAEPAAYSVQLWRNTGTNFARLDSALPVVLSGAMAWGDFDNDGLIDLLISGLNPDENNVATPITEVWRNTGSGFVNMNAGLTGLWGGSTTWGDYDNDGRLDILLAGTLDGSNYVSQVWHNDGGGHFSNINAGLPGVAGSAVWGDYDNDGRLDILLA